MAGQRRQAGREPECLSWRRGVALRLGAQRTARAHPPRAVPAEQAASTHTQLLLLVVVVLGAAALGRPPPPLDTPAWRSAAVRSPGAPALSPFSDITQLLRCSPHQPAVSEPLLQRQDWVHPRRAEVDAGQRLAAALPPPPQTPCATPLCHGAPRLTAARRVAGAEPPHVASSCARGQATLCAPGAPPARSLAECASSPAGAG